MLPDDLALATRQFLTRMYELRPEVAARMGYDLMVEVARYVPPPPNTPPWAFLAAVTAERRARQMMKAEAERRTVWEQNQRAMASAQANAQAAWSAGQQPYTPPQQTYLPPQPPPIQGQGQQEQEQVPPAPDGDGFRPPE